MRATRVVFVVTVIAFTLAVLWNAGSRHGPRPSLAQCSPTVQVCGP